MWESQEELEKASSNLGSYLQVGGGGGRGQTTSGCVPGAVVRQ